MANILKFTKNKEWLKKEYLTKTAKQIAEELGVNKETIHYWLHKFEINKLNRHGKRGHKQTFTKKWLFHQYKKKSLENIAKETKVTRETIRNWFIRYGIPRDNRHKIRLSHDKQFSKGQTPWNKNFKYDEELKNKLNTNGLNLGHLEAENHLGWTGEKPKYMALQRWAGKKYGRPNKCENCGANKKCWWSNKHGLRKKEDFMALCPSCIYYLSSKRPWPEDKPHYKANSRYNESRKELSKNV